MWVFSLDYNQGRGPHLNTFDICIDMIIILQHDNVASLLLKKSFKIIGRRDIVLTCQ